MQINDWKKLIAEWQRSGQSQSEFCRRRSLTKSRFVYWRQKLEREKNGEAGFVEVGASRDAEPMEIRLSSGTTIRVPSGFEPEALRQILEVLQ